MESAPAAGGATSTPRRQSWAQQAADKRRVGGGGKEKGGEGGGDAPPMTTTPRPKKQRASHAAKKEKKRVRDAQKGGEDDRDAEVEASVSAGEAPMDEDKQRAAHWTDCAWFVGSGGDLAFAQWMLGRCSGVGDARTPNSRATVERVHALYLVQKRLRLELALSSSASATVPDQDAEENDDTDAEDEHGPSSSGASITAWSVEAIVEEVARALQPSRLALARAKSAARRGNAKFEGGLEKIVVSEVVEHATELLLSRAGDGEGTKELEKWIALLSEDMDAAESNAEESGAPEEDGNPEDNSSTTSKKAKKKEQRQRERGKGKDAEKTACEQTRAFLQFLAEFDSVAPLKGQTSLPPMTEAMAAALPLWTQELQQIYDDCRINAVDEARRLAVAREIQGVLRTHVSKWRHCEVVLFGSSLSHYGSKHSDMDMCLIPKPETTTMAASTRPGDDSTSSKQAVGLRQIRQLIKAGQTCEASGENGNGSKSGEQAASIEVLLDLDDHVTKSIEKLTLAYNGMDNGSRNEKNGYGAPSNKENKQRKQFVFFLDHWQHLSRAIRHELEVLIADRGADSVAAYKAAAAERQAHLKSLIMASRRRIDDMYLLQGMLQRTKCTIRLMIRGARIPIIRFTHNPTGFECDLCFENVLATRNTLLLRAYAEVDERARVLGLAVKHWAKQRGISDASMGFFSSYTFVLLSIYFLQQKSVGVLPNLQHPDLLERANQPRHVYNGVDISFCTNVQLARVFHEQNLTTEGSSNMANSSVAELLAGFFRFYATSFDFARDVVTVRDPAVLSTKVAKWGPQKAKTWRMSVEDPLETSRDLGCVLQFKGQDAILREFRRANELMTAGASFATVICEAAAAASNAAATTAAAAANGGKRGGGKPEERAYMITLWSADRELTKPAIVTLFKSFDASFRVGKILEKRDKHDHIAGNTTVTRRKWVVELRTKALQCPRTLAQKTRIDWEEVESKQSNGKDLKGASKQRIGRGVVWIHHTELHENAPCVKCFSPQHLERDCQEQGGEAYQKRHVLRITVSGVSARSTSTNSNHQNKVKRANARQVQRHHSDGEEDQENDDDDGGHADRGEPRTGGKSSVTSGGNVRNRERRRNKDAVDGNNGEHSARNMKPKVSASVTSESNAASNAVASQIKRHRNKEDALAGEAAEGDKDSKKKKAQKWVRSGGDSANRNKRRTASAKPAPAL